MPAEPHPAVPGLPEPSVAVSADGDKLYKTVIPRNVRLAEAPSFGMPALAYDKQSRGAVAYLALAGELVRRSKQAARAAAAVTDANE
jgi:chromosome partitioning protein